MSILDRLNPAKQKKEVMLLNPDDNRYTSIQVDREVNGIIYCKKHEGIQHTFFNHGPAWNGKILRFLAVEGTPLISYATNKTIDGTKINAKTDLLTFIKLSLGENNYNKLEVSLKEKLAEHSVGSTVTVKPYIPDDETQKIFNKVTAKSILFDADLNNLADMGESKETEKWHDKLFDKIPWILTGVALNYIAEALGVLS